MPELLVDHKPIEPITINQVVDFFRGGWRVIARCSIASIVICLVWISASPRVYQATAVFASVNTGGVSALQDSALRNLASLARPGIGSYDRTTPFIKFQALLTSVRVAQILNANHPEIQRTIYKGMWDDQQKRWRHPSGLIPTVTGSLKSVLGMRGWQEPSDETLAVYLASHLKITTDELSGLLTVRYDSGDPVFAANVLKWTCEAADDVLRKMARSRTNRRIVYLKAILPNVTVAAQRDTLIDLLSQQQQSSMIIEADPSYSAEAIVLPTASNIPIWPKPSVMFMACLILGVVVGLGLHYFTPSLKLFNAAFKSSSFGAPIVWLRRILGKG